jgi:hypothetical protein
MRAVLMLVITWMVLSPEIVTTTQAAPARANRVSVSYVPPKNPAHQPILDQLREVSCKNFSLRSGCRGRCW